MSSPFAGGLGDALKQLLYLEVLAHRRPRLMLDSHAGQLRYVAWPTPSLAEAGVVRLATRGRAHPALKAAALWAARPEALLPHPSCLSLALRALPEARFFAWEASHDVVDELCADLKAAAVVDRVTVRCCDGLGGVLDWLSASAPPAREGALVFLDPFLMFRDDHSPTDGLSVLSALMDANVDGVLFFAFNGPARYAQAQERLAPLLARGAEAHVVRRRELTSTGEGPVGAGLVVSPTALPPDDRLGQLTGAAAEVLDDGGDTFMAERWAR